MPCLWPGRARQDQRRQARVADVDRHPGRDELGPARPELDRRVDAGAQVHPRRARRRVRRQERPDPLVEDPRRYARGRPLILSVRVKVSACYIRICQIHHCAASAINLSTVTDSNHEHQQSNRLVGRRQPDSRQRDISSSDRLPVAFPGFAKLSWIITALDAISEGNARGVLARRRRASPGRF